MSLKIFTPENMPVDDGAVKQMETCMAEGNATAGVLCADHHLGYSMPIGGAIAYPEHISPSGVGYDIGCGNKAVATSLFYSDISDELPQIMQEVSSRISFGMGRNNANLVDHEVIDHINENSPTKPIHDLLTLARKQLGTVGGGNHYVDLFREEETDRIWVGVHFGSRGFGHKIASGFLALAQGKEFHEHASGGEMHSPPVLFRTDEPLGYMYIEAMKLAGEYAYAGRDVVVDEVLSILGSPDVIKEVHNHHNFAWYEEDHYDGPAWVVRKGSTPLFPGQEGFVGSTMGENSVIIEGTAHNTAAGGTGASSLWSAPHGAGRLMSRTQAKGKSRKRWSCCNRDCDWTQGFEEHKPEDNACPKCGNQKLSKNWVQLSKGEVDWDAARDDLKSKNIYVIGGDADEAPLAYKRLPEVLKAHGSYVKVTHQLRPIGVVMAGPEVKDLYKD